MIPLPNQQPVIEETEEILPLQAVVASEPELPVPTPVPTPDPAILRAEEEREQLALNVAACISLLDSQHITCSATPQERESMSGDTVYCVEHIQVSQEAKTIVDNSTNENRQDIVIFRVPFQPNLLKENFQSLTLFCINQVSKNYTTSFQDPQTEDEVLGNKRAQFAQQLVKYSRAMSCIDSEDFPNCIPTDAKEIISHPPVADKWNCF